MGPQCEDGFTRIANELMDALVMTRIPGEAMQIFLAILRKTYGFGKKEDRISLIQFAEATGIPKPRIVRAVSKLVEMNIISKNGSGHWPSYSVNKYYDTWEKLPKKEILPKEAKLPKRATKIAEKGNSVAEKGKINCPIRHPQKKKETITKEKKDLLPICRAWNGFKAMRHTRKKPLTEYAERLAVDKLAGIVAKGFDPVHVMETAIEKGWLSFYEPKDPPPVTTPPTDPEAARQALRAAEIAELREKGFDV